MSRLGWTAVAALSLYGDLARRHAHAPGRAEARTFWWTNHRRTPALRVPQQLGTPWVLPVTGLVALSTGRRRLAVAAGLALPVEKGLEVLTKKFVERPRPAKVWSGVALRDDAPIDGPSFPSGHAAIATAAVVLTAPHLPTAVTGLLAAGSLLSGWARVEQGAHHPADVVGGVVLGVAVGAGLGAAIGRSE